jgi:hypothetical protein
MRWATQAIFGLCIVACGRKNDAVLDAAAPVVQAKRDVAVAIAEPDRSSSSLALATIGPRRVALLADEDDARLRVLALPDGKEIASTKLGGTPGHVVVDHDGVVWVALRTSDALASFSLSCAGDACDLSEKARVATCAEPIALATDPQSLFVACGWGAQLERHALPGGEKTASTAIRENARAILPSKNGDAIIVAHATGSVMTIVSTAAGMPTRAARLDFRDRIFTPGGDIPQADEPRFADQGYALARVDTATLAPMIMAYPGDPFVETTGYGPAIDAYFPHETAIAVVDADGPPRLRSRATVFAGDEHRVSRGRIEWPKETRPCLLPRAAAPDATRRSILVACAGIDEISEVDAEPKPLVDSMRMRWRVPHGPSAIAVDGREAWVWSSFDRKLSRIALPAVDATFAVRDVDAQVAIAPDKPLDPDFAKGRILFHEPIAFDGRACASCHPEARNDGLTWSSPFGPLQTPMLAGRLENGAPFGWRGDGATVEKHLEQTFKNLQARRIAPDELHAIVAFATHAKPNLAEREKTPLEERGRTIFESGQAGCTQCHHEGGRTGDGARHDIGTGGAFDTPSLRFVGGTAPYMHDGRYTTLREVLVKTEGKMGTTKHLREPEVEALIAYLRSI